MSHRTALRLAGIRKHFGATVALAGVDLEVRAGEVYALIGENGAGKSTLFSLITRLFGIQSGRISIFGHDIGRAPSEALRLMGVVFQPHTLDLDLSVDLTFIAGRARPRIGFRDHAPRVYPPARPHTAGRSP